MHLCQKPESCEFISRPFSFATITPTKQAEPILVNKSYARGDACQYAIHPVARSLTRSGPVVFSGVLRHTLASAKKHYTLLYY